MNTIKIAKREGTKNGRAWTAYAVEVMANGQKYTGLLFPPRTNEISEADNLASTFQLVVGK